MGPETTDVSEDSLATTSNGVRAATGTGGERAPHEQMARTSDSSSHCMLRWYTQKLLAANGCARTAQQKRRMNSVQCKKTVVLESWTQTDVLQPSTEAEEWGAASTENNARSPRAELIGGGNLCLRHRKALLPWTREAASAGGHCGQDPCANCHSE